MPDGPTRYAARDRGGITVVRVEGSVLRAESDAFRDRLQAFASEGKGRLVLDFEALDALDSSGLGACAGLAKRLGAPHARGIAVFGANRTVEKMWRMVGLEGLVPLFPAEDAAVAWVEEAKDD